jgi:hypothetical protein
MSLTKFYDDMLKDANDRYYNTYEAPVDEGASDAELEAYEEYVENGGEMRFKEWQKFIRDLEN